MIVKSFTCFQYLSCMIAKVIFLDSTSDLIIPLKKIKNKKQKKRTHTNLHFTGSFLLTE